MRIILCLYINNPDSKQNPEQMLYGLAEMKRHAAGIASDPDLANGSYTYIYIS
jgi:hypothetical protein